RLQRPQQRLEQEDRTEAGDGVPSGSLQGISREKMFYPKCWTGSEVRSHKQRSERREHGHYQEPADSVLEIPERGGNRKDENRRERERQQAHACNEQRWHLRGAGIRQSVEQAPQRREQ